MRTPAESSSNYILLCRMQLAARSSAKKKPPGTQRSTMPCSRSLCGAALRPRLSSIGKCIVYVHFTLSLANIRIRTIASIISELVPKNMIGDTLRSRMVDFALTIEPPSDALRGLVARQKASQLSGKASTLVIMGNIEIAIPGPWSARIRCYCCIRRLIQYVHLQPLLVLIK
jgi:hypothetical protein